MSNTTEQKHDEHDDERPLWRADDEARVEQSIEQHISALAGETVDGTKHHQSS